MKVEEEFERMTTKVWFCFDLVAKNVLSILIGSHIVISAMMDISASPQVKPARSDPVRRIKFRSDPVEKLSDSLRSDSDWRIRQGSQENTTESYRISSDFIGFRRYLDRNPTIGSNVLGHLPSVDIFLCSKYHSLNAEYFLNWIEKTAFQLREDNDNNFFVFNNLTIPGQSHPIESY